MVPRALLKFREARPGVEIEVADMSTLDQIEALIAGHIDVGFVRLPVNHPQLAVRKVLTERLTIATSSKFAGPVTMKSIQEKAFILIDRGVSATCHDHCISLCDRAGFAPRIVYEANDTFTILNLVSAGIGVALVPSAARAMHIAGVKCARPGQARRLGHWNGVEQETGVGNHQKIRRNRRRPVVPVAGSAGVPPVPVGVPPTAK